MYVLTMAGDEKGGRLIRIDLLAHILDGNLFVHLRGEFWSWFH